MRVPQRTTEHRSFLVVIALVLAASSVVTGQDANPVEDDADWWSSVQERIVDSEYEISWDPETGLAEHPQARQAPNRAHGFRTYFVGDGILVVPRTDREHSWRLELSLIGLGRGTGSAELGEPLAHADGNRFEYEREEITEWYVNSRTGLKHGFTIPDRPAGNDGDPLFIDLRLGGSLTPIFTPDGQAIDFTGDGNIATLRYGGLEVLDRTGTTVPARMGGSRIGGNRVIRIVIDDMDALYPLTVDPVLQDPAWEEIGEQVNARLGVSVATAGDVNRDGYSDVIVGSPTYDGGQTDEGRVFCYYGGPAGLPNDPNRFLEVNWGAARFGSSLATAGDVNGDGYSDIIVGAVYYNDGQAGEGAAFVYHGSASGLGSNWQAAWQSNQAEAFFGRSVASAGDVNGDGYSDVIVGAFGAHNPSNPQTKEGRVFVYYGSSSGLPVVPSWTAEGNQVGGEMGQSVATAGDVNRDRYSDIIVSAWKYSPGTSIANEGTVFVFHGSSSGLDTGSRPIGTPDNADWTMRGGEAQGYFGNWVDTAGDVNGDTYSDVVIGARYQDNGLADEGQVFVYHGGSGGLGSSAAWMAESNQASAYFGISVGTAGDVNSDGFADIVVGASHYTFDQTEEGAAFVYHGSPTGLDLNGTRPSGNPTNADWSAEGNQAESWFGVSAHVAGDVNGDGYSDIIVGAPYHDVSAGDSRGRAVVHHGAAAGLSETSWTTTGSAGSLAGDVNGDGYADFLVDRHLFYGDAWANIGSSPDWTLPFIVGNDGVVTTAGDVNGDDILYGDPDHTNPSFQPVGRVGVFHGSPSGPGTGSPDWGLVGDQADSEFGYSVAWAGDVNGDGYSDVIVGAPSYTIDPPEPNHGVTFVFYGSSTGLTGSMLSFDMGNQSGQGHGFSVAGAGDVNGDGFSDVIVGEPGTGEAVVYYGSTDGLRPWDQDHFANCYGDDFGAAVAGAGDVDGDGYCDVIIGAPECEFGTGYGEGAAYVYYGSPAGVQTSGWTEWQGYRSDALMGYSVAGAGDINGDGFADVLFGEPGRWGGHRSVYIAMGSESGASDTWIYMSGSSWVDFGRTVSSAGDLNGDGFSDVVIGSEDDVFVHWGNGGPGVRLRPRQYRYDTSGPIAPLGVSDNDMWMWMDKFVRSPFGRGRVRVEYELKPLGTPFDGTGTTFPYIFFDNPTGYIVGWNAGPLNEGTPYHWRVRTHYSPVTTPYLPHGRWVHMPWNGWNETDFRTTGCDDNDGDGYGSPASFWCPGGGELDCNDGNPNMYPGNTEVCDGVDNDCNGSMMYDEGDYDNDGVMGCAGDCDVFNGLIWAEPGEVPNLQFVGANTMSWDVPAEPGAMSPYYDVLRHFEPQFFQFATCHRSDIYNTTTSAGADPVPGQGYYYLVRADNDCSSSAGPLGWRSDGTPRPAGPACP
jgi:hypothetical protein